MGYIRCVLQPTVLSILPSLSIFPACDIPRTAPSEAPVMAAVLVFILGKNFAENGIVDTAAKTALVITIRGNIEPKVTPIAQKGCWSLSLFSFIIMPE
jgi:hypothetical protein